MTLVRPRVSVVFPAPESPTTPTTIALGTELLVAAAVEQQRRAGVLARVLDAGEEQRVVAAPVRALDARHEVGQRAVHKRCVLDDKETRLHLVRSSRKAIGQGGLALAEDADAV